MSDNFRIEDVQREDLDQIMVIEVEAFPTPWHIDSLQSSLERDATLFLALKSDSAIIGYSLSYIVAYELHLLKIAVDEHYQRRGFGSQILSETITRGRRRGVAIFWLEVRPSNEVAIAFYRRAGFGQSFVRKKYYTDTGEDALILTRRWQGEQSS